MAMKKAEMEAHQAEYDALIAEARSAEREGMFSRAVELAFSSWDHIDGMMQYGNRYKEKEFSSISGIDIVLRYAPLLLDLHSLDVLQDLLKSAKRIERNTSEDMSAKLAAARSLTWDAHRLWDHIERNPGARQDKLREALGGDQDKWRSIAETWEKMGLLGRTPEAGSCRLALATRMGGVVDAKCPACGNVVNGPKAMLLEASACPHCGQTVLFVILATASAAAKG